MTIAGSSKTFAIESAITIAYASPSWLGLGYIVIHLGGRSYGVRDPRATLLACSFDEVSERLSDRGLHRFPFAESDAAALADGYREAIYGTEDEWNGNRWDIDRDSFCHHIQTSRIQWAPDGDEAFDDSSYILQFDIGEQVRIIAFQCTQGLHHDPGTLREMWIPEEEFYGILREWQHAFLSEWKSLPLV